MAQAVIAPGGISEAVVIRDSVVLRRSLAVLIACHNRRELTLRALRALHAPQALFKITVVLFDDASSDGTADAVRAEFPDTVIVAGDGQAFWNRGMHAAWSYALSLRPDACLWLNDDVALDDDALLRLHDAWREIEAEAPDGAFVLAGAVRNARGAVTYGGIGRKFSPFSLRFENLPEARKIQPVDTFNGNIVLVPAATVARIGINDPAYFHMYGDIDYGLRAGAAGIPVLLLAGTLGVCEGNPPPDLSALNLAARWRFLLASPRGLRPASWWRLVRRHSGIWAPLHFIMPYRRLFYPAAWLRRARSG